MITIVHGSDSVSSRKYFLSQKDEESITFDAESLNPVEFNQSLQGSGLFGVSNKIFIENLFTRKGTKSITTVGEILTNNKEAVIFIWADKEIGVKILSSFPKFEFQNFKIPQNIWSFLDGLRPDNPLNVSSFHKTLNETDPEIIFTMIIRQFRLMIGLSGSSNNNIDEIKRLAPWQKSKLVHQASLFGVDKLKQIYKKLYKIDKSQKTGKSPLTLVQDIDILMLEI